ncbi:TetR/AcrR family transcriptional regulator [Natronosporangium hydrolyticum]|uniref:TetR/AcrR family transcriptional regulator n=1 Tax=Natronosporangium hydrolyticum TaxID=2811111 RepID=A0A895Y675_9ACTN|nr:TetR/AcrR family transcriptional regulator [Natronosporangium hydrolyticum]QSB12881.1 TetR/AcrR family transcriptional regulator [Natronosporangium hydrolyticum]
MDTVEEAPGPRRNRRRGPYAKTEQKRREILDSALEVFAKSGYRAGSLREVAERVGMSEAGLLHHFPNKSALLSAVLRRRDEHTMSIVPVEDDDPVAALKGLVELAAYNASRPGVVELYCVLSAEATTPDHPAHSYFVERYAWVRKRLSRTFQLLQQQGSLHPGVSPESAARSTIAVMDGLQLQWLLDRDSLDMAEEFRRHLDSLVTFELG